MSFCRIWRAALLLTCVCVTIGVTGCTPAPVEVTGTIKIKGQAPKTKGLQIFFLAADGRTASGDINPDGTYTAKEVPVGEIKVSFVYASADARAAKEKGGRLPPKAGKDAEGGSQADNPIPEAYREASTSKVTCTVVAGKPNTFDYDIK